MENPELDMMEERANDLNDSEHQNEISPVAKQVVKESQDITGSKCLKGVSGKEMRKELKIHGRSTRKN